MFIERLNAGSPLPAGGDGGSAPPPPTHMHKPGMGWGAEEGFGESGGDPGKWRGLGLLEGLGSLQVSVCLAQGPPALAVFKLTQPLSSPAETVICQTAHVVFLTSLVDVCVKLLRMGQLSPTGRPGVSLPICSGP